MPASFLAFLLMHGNKLTIRRASCSGAKAATGLRITAEEDALFFIYLFIVINADHFTAQLRDRTVQVVSGI